jgi:hypothetical protein
LEHRSLVSLLNEFNNQNSHTKNAWQRFLLDCPTIRCMPTRGCQPQYCLCGARNPSNIEHRVLKQFLTLQQDHLQRARAVSSALFGLISSAKDNRRTICL